MVVRTLDDMCNLVYIETNRPDMIDQTIAAVRASTLKMHSLDGNFFARDLSLVRVDFPTSAYLQSFTTDPYLPRYRAMKYLRKWDDTYADYQSNPNVSILPSLQAAFGVISVNEALAPFTEISVDDIFDDYKTEKVNVWYQAGDSINLKSSTLFASLLVMYYQFPDIGLPNASTYNSWIANTFHNCIVLDASASIYRAIGDLEAARDIMNPRNGLLLTELRSLIANNVTSTGS